MRRGYCADNSARGTCCGPTRAWRRFGAGSAEAADAGRAHAASPPPSVGSGLAGSSVCDGVGLSDGSVDVSGFDGSPLGSLLGVDDGVDDGVYEGV